MEAEFFQLVSHLFHWLGTTVTYEVINPQTHKVDTTAVNSLPTADGLRFMLTSVVRNFANFAPVGIILEEADDLPFRQ